MGGIIGGVIGGIGSIFGGQQGENAAFHPFNVLNKGPIGQNYLNKGGAANDMIAQLLGTEPMKSGTQNAYDNYLNSTGYNFRLASGSNAITGNMAAKGLLNSGATGKALTAYGQDLGSGYFSNYLDQLGNQANRGIQAGDVLAKAGGAGASAAAQSAAGGAGGAVGDIMGILPFRGL